MYSSTYSFPPVPTDSATFISQGLNKRPTFFGCDTTMSSDAPLVIYIANGGPPLGQLPLTNTTTFQMQYPRALVEAMLDQVFDVATQGIPTRAGAPHQHHGGTEKEGKDPLWPVCLACAVVDRSRRTLGVRRTGVCVRRGRSADVSGSTRRTILFLDEVHRFNKAQQVCRTRALTMPILT